MSTYTTQVYPKGESVVEREEKMPQLWYGVVRFDAEGDCREMAAVYFSTRAQMEDLYAKLGAMLQDGQVEACSHDPPYTSRDGTLTCNTCGMLL